jgi:hypothetical protein
VAAVVEPKLDDAASLSVHGLGPLAADILDRRGRAVPDTLRRQQHVARLASLTAVPLLERIRESCSGTLVLLKGPEVAARYPHRARGFGDIDLLVPDARRTQAELIAAGFEQLDDPEGVWIGIHHLARLRLPGSPLPIEVHSVPKWPDGLRPPRADELFAAAVPSDIGIDGVLAPSVPHHALLLAAHAWAHQPLGRARDLIDVGAFRVVAGECELARLARAWGMTRPWRTMVATLDALVSRSTTWPLRLWARHIWRLRDQTVLEAHLEHVLAPFWGYPPAVASRRSAAALWGTLRPAFDEGWTDKIRRSATAARRPLASVGEHRRLLGGAAYRGQQRNSPEGSEPVQDGRARFED